MITVPLKPGDPVVLHFSQRSLENWLSGSDQAPDDPRQFDLSDAFATPVMRPGPVADTENLTVQYGPGSLKLAPDGSLTVRVPRQHVIAQETIFDSPVTVNGLLTYTAGMAGSGGSGSSISISGGASFEGERLCITARTSVRTIVIAGCKPVVARREGQCNDMGFATEWPS